MSIKYNGKDIPILSFLCMIVMGIVLAAVIMFLCVIIIPPLVTVLVIAYWIGRETGKRIR